MKNDATCSLAGAVARSQGPPRLPTKLLRWRIARAFAWATIGAVAQRGLNLAAWVYCARTLGKTAFGELSIVMTTAAVPGTLAGLGLGVAATRYVAAYRHADVPRAGRVLGLVVIMPILSGAAAFVLMITLAPMLASKLLMDCGLAPLLRAASLIVLCNAVGSSQSGALAGFEAFRCLTRVGIVSGVAAFPLIALGARCDGLRGAVCGFGAAQLFNCLLGHRALRRECAESGVRVSIAGCARELPVLWRFVLPALLSSALLVPAMWACNLWLARQPGGYAQLALYAAADRWRLLILFLPTSLIGTVLPMLASLQGARDRDGFGMVLRTSLLVNLPLVAVPAMAVALLARPLLLTFGSSYGDGWLVLAILAAASIFEALNTVLGQAVVLESMWRRLAFDVLLATVLLCGAPMLVHRWGASGLAAAYLIAYTAVAGALSLYTRRSIACAAKAEQTLA